MKEAIKVLDHGSVRLVEAWGHGDAGQVDERCPNEWENPDLADFECGIIEAARQSTQGSFRGWEQDQKLLTYLHKHKHSTPFEFAGMTLEIVDPTCVVWEWVRHRTVGIEYDDFQGDTAFNVMSSRYGKIPNMDYVPTVERLFSGDIKNKQSIGLDGKPLDEYNALVWIDSLKELYERAEATYQHGLEVGVPKEIARLALTFGRYWKMRVTANLRNWCSFCTLRSSPEAQYEIRVYSEAVEMILSETFPKTYELFAKIRSEK